MSKIKVIVRSKRSGREVLFGGKHLPLVFPYGLAPNFSSIKMELNKIKLAEKLGADVVKDNTIGRREWKTLLEEVYKTTCLPVGASATIVAANIAAEKNNGKHSVVERKDFFDAFEILKKYCDCIEVFPSLDKKIVQKLEKSSRIFKHSVSRAGSIIAEYLKKREEENPFVSDWDWFVEEAKKEDIVFIFGNGLRAGSIHDSLDEFQFYEFRKFKEYWKKASRKGVDVITGVIGHTHPSKINELTRLRKYLPIPLGGLGPLVTDIGMGYDHINAAIGIVYLQHYIDWVSLITPSEHIGLPGIDEVYKGMSTINLARHIVDIIRNNGNVEERDKKVSIYRANLQWDEMAKASIDPYIHMPKRKNGIFCDLCGSWCPIYRSKKKREEYVNK